MIEGGHNDRQPLDHPVIHNCIAPFKGPKRCQILAGRAVGKDCLSCPCLQVLHNVQLEKRGGNCQWHDWQPYLIAEGIKSRM